MLQIRIRTDPHFIGPSDPDPYILKDRIQKMCEYGSDTVHKVLKCKKYPVSGSVTSVILWNILAGLPLSTLRVQGVFVDGFAGRSLSLIFTILKKS